MAKLKTTHAILPLFLTVFIDALGWGMVYPVFAPLFISNATGMFANSMSIADREFYFEFAIAIYCILMFIMSPILGSLSDRHGRKTILLLSLAGCAAGFFVSAIGIEYNSYWLIMVGRAIAGATAGSFPIAQAAMVDISEPHQKASRLGLSVVANGIGFACGPVIGGLLLDANIFHGTYYQLPFWISGIFAIIGLVLLNVLFQETHPKTAPTGKLNFLSSFTHLYQAVTKPGIRFYCLLLALFMLSWVVFFTEMPIFLTRRFDDTGAAIGYYMTYLSVFFVIGMVLLMPYLLRRLALIQIVVISLMVQAICQLAFSDSHHAIWLWVVGLPLVLCVPFSYVGITTITSNHVDSEHQGAMMGVLGSITALCWGIGPLLTGALDQYNLIDPYFASIVLMSLAIIMALTQYKKI